MKKPNLKIQPISLAPGLVPMFSIPTVPYKIAVALVCGALVAPVSAAPASKDLTLVAPGRIPTVVVMPDAVASEKFAAQELATYLGKISGQKIPIIESKSLPTQKLVVIIGHHPANASLHPEKLGVEESVVAVEANQVRIVGGMKPPVDLGKDKDGNEQIYVNDRGTLYGVYELLNDLGVRWYRPEPWGEFVPQTSTIKLTIGQRSSAPVFTYRQGMNSYRWWKDETREQRSQARLWGTRNRQNTNMWTGIEQGGYRIVNFDHSYRYLVPHEAYFATHPEYFALIDGQRSTDVNAQLCLGNKAVQDLVTEKIIQQAKDHPEQEIASLEPNDGHAWCQCELCTAMDDPQLINAATSKVSKANRVAAFNNIIAKRLAAAMPGAKVGWLAYNQHTEVPTLVKSLEPNTIVRAAAYANGYSDYSRKLRDPASPQNARFLQILEGYGKLAPLGVYEYWSGYAWFGPLPVTSVMVDRLREYRKLNVDSVYLEAHPSWGPQGIDLYMFTRLLWNPNMDVQKELDLYYKNYYGPAAKAMKSYHELIETKSQGGPIYYGGGYNLQKLFTPDLVSQMGEYMDQARQQVKGKAPYEQRLEGVWAGYEFVRRLNEFFRIRGQSKLMEAAATFDDLERFVQSYKEGDVFDNGPVMYDSIMGFTREVRADLNGLMGFFEKFKNPQIAGAYDKQWRFQTDPKQNGTEAGWSGTDFDDTAWPHIDANRWWQEQGYEGYHGVAWYRRQIPTPDHKDGQRVILYFGAVDGDATVYVNGKEVGQHVLLASGDGWDKPFNFDVTDALVQGRENSVVVRVKKDNFMSGIYKGMQVLVVDGLR
jgi:hypothetical protein